VFFFICSGVGFGIPSLRIAPKFVGAGPGATQFTVIFLDANSRASVRETVLTYPLLAGMGITAGENMPMPSKDFSKEKWLWQTYGEGIRDAVKLQPGRQFRLIHRFHMTGLDEVLNAWKEYPGPFDFSFKYAIAHMYSVPNPPFIKEALPHLSPQLRSWLTVRNDDIYSFRWGDPEYARAFIRAMPGKDKMAGQGHRERLEGALRGYVMGGSSCYFSCQGRKTLEILEEYEF
jgi:hypothetical protein